MLKQEKFQAIFVGRVSAFATKLLFLILNCEGVEIGSASNCSGCKMALQVLFLVLGLFLGQNFEVRAQPSGPPSFSVPANSSAPTNSTWNVTPGEPDRTILKSPNGTFSFNLLLTTQSISSCAAVVQHTSSKVNIWVANFNATYSVNKTSMCRLNFTQDVGLVLFNGNQTIWNTSVYLAGKYFDRLQLEDNGYLYIRNQTDKDLGKSPWKSIDFPTDTLINGQSLYSGNYPMSAALLNYEYSTGGIFYMRVDGSSVTLSQDFKVNGTAGLMPYNSSVSSNTTLSYVKMAGALEVYGRKTNKTSHELLHRISNGGVSTSNNTSWEYARLGSNGGLVLKLFASQEPHETLFPLLGADDCSLPANCGSFGICSAGVCSCPDSFVRSNLTTGFSCQREEALNTTDCSREFFNFTGRTYMNLVNTNVSEADYILAQDCEDRCRGNCTCTNALHVKRIGSQLGACFVNLTSMQTFQEVNGGLQMLFLRSPLDVAVAPSSTKSSRRTAALAFAGAAGALLMVFVLVSVWWLFRTRRQLFDDADGGKLDYPSQPVPQFSYKQLEEATDNFFQRLGYGGYSSVYAGHLPNNSKIAVKVLDGNGHIKEKELLAAMATVGGVSHPNLVPLRGLCSEGKHRMLVSELVNEGRSLNYFLFRPDSGPLMDVQTRQAIALATARGLAYLHEDLVVIHGGVKPENIMMDKEMHPQLADYGLISLVSRFQRLNSASAHGSRAYMAPDWAKSAPITEKVDVYSFGVVMLELVSGRSCLIPTGVPEERRFLPSWGFAILRRHPDRLLELADPHLDVETLSDTDQQVLKGMTFIALWCVQEDPSFRPPMSHVVKMLDGDAPVDVPPPCPALDALARDLCGDGTKSLEGDRFMHSPAMSENAEMRPSPLYSPRVDPENSRHDRAWLLATQQSL